jgi:hypothetical protein
MIMSLDFNLTQCSPDLRTQYPPTDNGEMNVITYVIIFSTMSTGIGTLTDATAPEFWARLNIIQKLRGPLMYQGDQPYYLTRDDVQAHLGLSTNVFRQATRAAWLKSWVGGEMTDYVREYQRP